jgi:hypothetical protein|tara:strand:- start:6335 stop:6589 length:255 start_codon:yes stop_codon:yes gene_type:complete
MDKVPNYKLSLKQVFNIFKQQDLHQDGSFSGWIDDQIDFEFDDTYDLYKILNYLKIDLDEFIDTGKAWKYRYFDSRNSIAIKKR